MAKKKVNKKSEKSEAPVSYEKSPLEIKVQIREAESKKREEKAKVLPKEIKISFESWYHARMARFPKYHMKEIIWADFKSRKLSEEEKAEDYDKALERYGIKLD